jgi:hypothetical protein
MDDASGAATFNTEAAAPYCAAGGIISAIIARCNAAEAD